MDADTTTIAATRETNNVLAHGLASSPNDSDHAQLEPIAIERAQLRATVRNRVTRNRQAFCMRARRFSYPRNSRSGVLLDTVTLERKQFHVVAHRAAALHRPSASIDRHSAALDHPPTKARAGQGQTETHRGDGMNLTPRNHRFPTRPAGSY